MRKYLKLYVGSTSILLTLSLEACAPKVQLTPPPASAPAEVVALSGASVFIGVGDIASCSQSLGVATANLVDSVLRADSIAKVDDAVFTLGDNVYPSGSKADFEKCFTPSWGDPKRRIIKKLRPTPGNHEFFSPSANAYYEYFGDKAGENGKGYYSYEVGKWHVIVLNSEIVVNSQFSTAAKQAQLDWLTKDLESHKETMCTVAYWHNPRFSSGWHGSDARFQPIWQILYDRNVDLVLAGHDHEYERFRPMTPAGVLDTVKGITEIVAGTGGEELRGFSSPIQRNSAYRIEGRAGVLLLTLGAAEWRSAFLEVGGRIWDQSGAKCH